MGKEQHDHSQRQERRRALREQIDRALQESMESGSSTPMTAADWERIRREGKKQVAAKKRKQT